MLACTLLPLFHHLDSRHPRRTRSLAPPPLSRLITSRNLVPLSSVIGPSTMAQTPRKTTTVIKKTTAVKAVAQQPLGGPGPAPGPGGKAPRKKPAVKTAKPPPRAKRAQRTSPPSLSALLASLSDRAPRSRRSSERAREVVLQPGVIRPSCSFDRHPDPLISSLY